MLTLRDVQWRARRFLVAVLATSIAFAISLLMSWVDAQFHREPTHILAVLGADAWLVDHRTSGPFTAANVIPEATVDQVAHLRGVRVAEPVVLLHSTVRAGAIKDVNVIGLRLGSAGLPAVVRGREPEGTGQAVADKTAGFRLGQTVDLAGRDVRIVGLARGITYYFGQPTIVVPITDAQGIAFAGQPLASAVMTRGVPVEAPAGMRVMTPGQVGADLVRVVASTTQTIAVINVLLALMAVGIIGLIVYLSALERARDFAVLKATGIGSGPLAAGLVVEAVGLSVVGAVIGAVLAKAALVPLIPFPVHTGASSFVSLALMAVAAGVLASAAGSRQALRADPAMAFRAA